MSIGHMSGRAGAARAKSPARRASRVEKTVILNDDGSRYAGDVQNGEVPQGRGTFTGKDGNAIYAEWRNSKICPEHVNMTYSDGRVFQGSVTQRDQRYRPSRGTWSSRNAPQSAATATVHNESSNPSLLTVICVLSFVFAAYAWSQTADCGCEDTVAGLVSGLTGVLENCGGTKFRSVVCHTACAMNGKESRAEFYKWCSNPEYYFRQKT